MKKNSRRHVPQPRRIELDYAEKWGKDVEEATRLALADLNISEREAIVTVLEQPTKGFLGIGAKLAKVRVEKNDSPKQASETETKTGIETETETGSAEQASEKPADEEGLSIGKVRDLRKNKGEGAPAASAGSARASGGRADRPRRGGSEGRGGSERRGDRRERRRGGERDEPRESHEPRAEDKEGKTESRSYWLSSEGRDRSRRPSQPRRFGQSEAEKQGNADRQPPAAPAAPGERFFLNDRPTDLRPVSGDNTAAAFFREVVKKMGLDVSVRAFENDECVYLEVEGADSRTVIGKRGQTLDAIQYLTNLVMNKTQDKYIRVIVDVEGYRSRREKTLEHLAVKIARKVERTGRNVRLEPMNPYERKVIHATLQTNGNISTRSEGEEPYRRVIIERK
jgi:spoIIIJ-associated protein